LASVNVLLEVIGMEFNVLLALEEAIGIRHHINVIALEE
jgi:hypothetical protein